MKNETWEMSTLDWSLEGFYGAIVSPADVAQLISAENKQKVRNAFFIVADAVGQNGYIYPCALTVTKTVLAALPNCGKFARSECLDLLTIIAAARFAPDAPPVAEACLLEIRNATWYFIWGLQFDDVDLASLYVDILGCLGMGFPDFKATAEHYLTLALTRNLPDYDIVMVKNTIAELQE
ncbi:hypothetical protein [Undibacterium sp. TJN19]|uniref:hypothetical protein n=1 Tax=Undibacterium sp. TJN19 TaxID=3413055 RepID=UPI003BF25B0B